MNNEPNKMNKEQSLSSSSPVISNLTETLLGHLGLWASCIITSTPVVSHTVHATKRVWPEALNRTGGDRGCSAPFSTRIIVVVVVVVVVLGG
jgi:hypothetical protein